MLRRIFNKQITETINRNNLTEILAESDANFFGLETRGSAQIRGNGVLFLTTDKIVFGMFKPANDIVIPLSRITAINIVESHLDKRVFHPLLKVVFTNNEGAQDSAAWWIAKPHEWKTLLEKYLQ